MIYFLILAAAVMRFLPHEPNFVPIAALALFGAVYLDKKYALIMPMAAMFLADLFIGFYNPILMASVYGSFLVIGLIGLWLRNNKNLPNTIGASLTGSVLFFLATNFTMWAIQPSMPTPMYPPTLSGLADAYIMGLPFFRNTLLGDLFYTGIMFGLAEIIIKYVPRLSGVKETNGIYLN